MTNTELVAELLKWPPKQEVMFIEEHVVRWNEDNTPRITGYYQAYPYEVYCSKDRVVIRGRKK